MISRQPGTPASHQIINDGAGANHEAAQRGERPPGYAELPGPTETLFVYELNEYPAEREAHDQSGQHAAHG